MASVKNVMVWFTNESKMAVDLSSRNPSYKNFHLKKLQKIYRTGKNLYYQPVSSEGNGVSWTLRKLGNKYLIYLWKSTAFSLTRNISMEKAI